jgi:NADP-dependent 3-hydroxy acid dehydrogenase YdfG
MPGRLNDKVAIITGGTSGIGEATVNLFVAEGAKVLIVGRNADKGREMAAKLGDCAAFVGADVRRKAEIAGAIEAAVQRFGRLDCLFNNAGGPSRLATWKA